ncbi:MAG TPA: hypothetical protein VFR67_03095 [Pilimelia sp.]|nr:hypothetical protein [Pilimelia sp.]
MAGVALLVGSALVGAPAAARAAAAGDQVWVGGGTSTSAYRYVAAGDQAGVPFGVYGTSVTPVTVRVDASSLAGHLTVTGISGTACTWTASGGGTCTFLPDGERSARVLVRASAQSPAGPAGRLHFRLVGGETVAATALIDVRVGGDVTDLAVAGSQVTGQVGASVVVPMTVRNLGPNTSPRWELRLAKVPDGVAFTGGSGCARGAGGVVVCTASPHLRAGASQTVRPTFRIDRAGSDPAGRFTLHPALADPNRANELLGFAVRVPGAPPPIGKPPAAGLEPGGGSPPVAPAGGTTPTPAAPSVPSTAVAAPPDSAPPAAEIGVPDENESAIGAAARLGGRTPVSGIALAAAGAGVLLGLGALAVTTRRRRRAARIRHADQAEEPGVSATAELPVVGTGWTHAGVVAASGAYYPAGEGPGEPNRRRPEDQAPSRSL